MPPERWRFELATVALTALSLLELWTTPGMTDAGFAPVGVVLLCLPLALAGRYPVAGALALAVLGAVVPQYNGDFPGFPAMVATALAFRCGAVLPRRSGLAIAAALAVGGRCRIRTSWCPRC